MAKKHVFHGPVDFKKFEAQNVRLQNLFTFPPDPFEGQVIYKSDLKIGAFYDGDQWLFFGFTEEKRQTLIEIGREVDEEGNTIQHVFPATVRGLPAVDDSEFVTKSQLPVFTRYGLISGGTIQYSGTGLTYNFSRAVLEIFGECIAEAGQVTLDPADADDPRFDGLGWRKVSEGVADRIKVTGDSLPSPPFPQFNLETEVEGIFVSVPALATVPSGIVTENVYLENTEWAVSFAGLGTGNSASTANPKDGALAIEGSVVRNGFKIILDRGSVLDLNTLTDATFGGDMDLKATLGNNQNFDVIFLDGSGNPASNLLPISLNKASLDYQFFAFNLNEFTFSTRLVRYIELRYRQNGSGSHLGFFVDNLKLQGGVSQPPTGADGDKGWSPVLAVISDGERRVLQVIDWTGGEGSKPATGLYIGSTGLVVNIASGIDIRGGAGVDGIDGTNGEDGREVELRNSGTFIQWRYVGDPDWINLIDLADLAGADGEDGDDGLNGWTPIFAIVSDGERRVLQVSDWTGGTGTKPTTGLFVGATGFEALIGDGVDIRGESGAGGGGGGGQSIGAYFDGMGSTVYNGSKVFIRAKSAMTITGFSIIAEGVSPTCEMDIKKIASGTALPSVSIVASAPPILSTGNALKSTILTGWTTAISADDILEISVVDCLNATKISFTLYP